MRRSLVLLVILGLALSACQSVRWPWQKQTVPPPDLSDLEDEDLPEPPPPVEGALRVSSQQRFTDIPLPVGAREDPRTYVFQSASLRVGRLVYTMRASMADLANFFMSECPAADWELKTFVQADGAELTFMKGGEVLLVRIREVGVTRSCEFEIHITPEPSP